jgi:hypothetical protein
MQTFNIPQQAGGRVQSSSRFSKWNIFRRDYEHYEGVPRINIYLLRILFALMFVFVTYDSWTRIINHTGAWNPVEAAAWCMWGAYSVISFIGIIRPLKMLPIVLFEIIYKLVWLFIVAYPLWTKGELAGSNAEGMTSAFMWVILPIVAMPWGYFFRTHLLGKRTA